MLAMLHVQRGKERGGIHSISDGICTRVWSGLRGPKRSHFDKLDGLIKSHCTEREREDSEREKGSGRGVWRSIRIYKEKSSEYKFLQLLCTGESNGSQYSHTKETNSSG